MAVETLTLAEFLLARITEDHDIAYGAAPSPWREGDGWDGTLDGVRTVVDRHGEVTGGAYYGGTYGHILRFDPTRMLAECDAKRRIVETAVAYGDGGELDMRIEDEWALALTLRCLALPYADHPDYREEWRP